MREIVPQKRCYKISAQREKEKTLGEDSTASPKTPSSPPFPTKTMGSSKNGRTPKELSTGKDSNTQSQKKTGGGTPAKSTDGKVMDQDMEGFLVDIE